MLVMSLLGDTMVVVMAMADVGVGQNIVEVNVEGQLSLTSVAVQRRKDQYLTLLW